MKNIFEMDKSDDKADIDNRLAKNRSSNPEGFFKVAHFCFPVSAQ